MRASACGLLLAASVFVAGCGSSSHPAAKATSSAQRTSPPPAPATTTNSAPRTDAATKLPGFLSTASNRAMFIQWQRQDNQVTGTLSESYYDPSDPTQLKAEADSFTGTITGSQIAISLDTGATWNGTLEGSSMTLSYTASDGSIQTLDFHSANAAQYNAAVAATKSQVSGAVAQQQQAQTLADEQQQVDSDASSLSYDLDTLSTATSDLANDTFSGDLSGIATDVQTIQGDLQTVRSDTPDVSCDDAGVASDDAGVAANDDGVLHNDAVVYEGDMKNIRRDIAELRTAQQKLSSDNAAVPSYISPDAPSTAEIGAAITAAQSAIAKEQRSIKAAESRAAVLVAQAKSVAAQAHQVGC